MEMSDDKFAEIVKKVIRLIAEKDPVKHAEVAKERATWQ